MPGAKKIVNIKNQFLHARQPHEEIFDICSDWFYMETLKKLSHRVIVQNLRPPDAATTTLAIME